MLAGRLARNRIFHRLSFPSSSKTISDTCALYVDRRGHSNCIIRNFPGIAGPSSLKRKRNKTTMVGASAAGVSPEEIESLRKQVEDLKVRHVYILDIKYFDRLDASIEWWN